MVYIYYLCHGKYEDSYPFALVLLHYSTDEYQFHHALKHSDY